MWLPRRQTPEKLRLALRRRRLFSRGNPVTGARNFRSLRDFGSLLGPLGRLEDFQPASPQSLPVVARHQRHGKDRGNPFEDLAVGAGGLQQPRALALVGPLQGADRLIDIASGLRQCRRQSALGPSAIPMLSQLAVQLSPQVPGALNELGQCPVQSLGYGGVTLVQPSRDPLGQVRSPGPGAVAQLKGVRHSLGPGLRFGILADHRRKSLFPLPGLFEGFPVSHKEPVLGSAALLIGRVHQVMEPVVHALIARRGRQLGGLAGQEGRLDEVRSGLADLRIQVVLEHAHEVPLDDVGLAPRRVFSTSASSSSGHPWPSGCSRHQRHAAVAATR